MKTTEKNTFIKANRILSKWRSVAWLLTIIIAFGGLYEHKLGLIVPPMITAMLSVAFFNGKYWCGNFCPHGSLFDKIILKFSNNKKIPEFFKSKLFATTVFIMFGWRIVTKMISAISNFSGIDMLDKIGLIFVSSYLMVVTVSIPLGLLFSTRVWCKFCPMGTMQLLLHRLGVIFTGIRKKEKHITLTDKDACKQCGKCSQVCPMQLTPHLEFDEDGKYRNEFCIKCKVCVANCPVKILDLAN